MNFYQILFSVHAKHYISQPGLALAIYIYNIQHGEKRNSIQANFDLRKKENKQIFN